MPIDPVSLMVAIINEHAPADIWGCTLLIAYPMLGNTNRGEIGEEFAQRYLHLHGITSGNGGRASPVDLCIGELRIEVKTASLGVDGTFQFNHVRLDRTWSHLLCLGICPDRPLFRGWPKGAVAEGVAGKLVRMAEEQAVTFKLTKRADAMQPIEDLPATIRTL